jgi:HEAT repeat protein
MPFRNCEVQICAAPIVIALCLAFICLNMGCGPSVNQYQEALLGSEPAKREQALLGLQKLGPSGRGALPDLMQLAEDKDPHTRRLALDAIGSMGREAWKANEVLTHSLHDEDVAVRRAAVVALGNLTRFPASALRPLIRCLADEDSLVREMAMNVFNDLGPDCVGTLARALSDTSAMERRAVARTLGRMGANAHYAREALKRACLDSDDEVRMLSEEALKRIENQ